jgi:methanogenic corrinoid protein MtbC1
MRIEQSRQLLIDAILKGDREQANRLLDEYASPGGSRAAMHDVLGPVLEDIGNKWGEEKISLAQGYVAGKVAEDLLLKIHVEEKKALVAPVNKGPVVVGNIEDDYHSLGRKLVSVFLQSAGWRVVDLGNDVTADVFIDTAIETGARVIGVSAMMYTTAGNIRRVRDELDRRRLTGKIMLAVGGAVFKFRLELAQEVGGDGTTANGFQAPKLIADLWERSLRESPI